MSNHKEEQEMELEALESIFQPDTEFLKSSDTEFCLVLKPHPQGEEENHVGVTLCVTYTDDYPDSAPEIDYKDWIGLPDEKQEAIKGKVDETVEANIGMAMIYMVAEACQEYLRDNNTKELSMHEQMLLREKGDNPDPEEEADEDEEEEEEEEPEWKGLAEKPLCPVSERITAESFAKWRIKFEAEMIEAGILKLEGQKAKSGKQFFMEAKEGAAGKADGKDSAADGKGEVGYDAALFGEDGLDDDDLDDMEDD